jgi:hypothetical protein
MTVSYHLKEQLKPSDKLIILKGQGHDHVEKNGDYLRALSTVLEWCLLSNELARIYIVHVTGF